MGQLREHTRFDLGALERQGREFLHLVSKSQGFGDKKNRFLSWLEQVQRVAIDGIDATERMALDDGRIAFEDFFSGGGMSQPQLVNLLRGMVDSLTSIRRGSTFRRVHIADDIYARFLRAALFEDGQLSLGAALSLSAVAKTAQLDMEVARKCAARIVDDDFGYEPNDSLEELQLDQDRIRFWLDEASRRSNRPSGSSPASSSPATSDAELLADVIERWSGMHEQLTSMAAKGSNVAIPTDQIADEYGALKAEARRLLEHYAPWLRQDWESAVRVPDPQWAEIERVTGDVDVSAVAREMRDRLPLLQAIDREMRRKMPTNPPTATTSAPSVPHAYRHLQEDLQRFHADYAFDKSVFVMMKFPDATHMEKWQVDCLERLYAALKDELDRHGLVARRADKKTYATSKQLWDNLCIYMLGSRYGVAILEDHVGDELNPNVALEYGFMKGQGREVILLKERRFKHLRADIVGTIPKEFDIDASHVVDERSIRDAVHDWLTDVGVGPKRAR